MQSESKLSVGDIMFEEYTCELCRRSGVLGVTEHHLIPREFGGAKMQVAWLCSDCHKQIHALYTNRELAMRLNTLEKLESDEKISKYLRYIRKQPPTKRTPIKKSREVRRKI